MRKLLALLSAVVVASMFTAGLAAAGSNKPNGTTVTGGNYSGFNFGGGLVQCSSTFSGTLTNTGATGIAVSMSTVSMTGCSRPLTVCGLPWTMETTTTSNHATWTTAITGVCIDFELLGPQYTCRYTGDLTNNRYEEATDTLVLGGALTKTSTSSWMCPNSGVVTGIYTVAPTDLDVNTL